MVMDDNEGGGWGFDGWAKEFGKADDAAVEGAFVEDVAAEDTITGIEEENP